MCRALKVLCVAEDADGLVALKRALVSAEWELVGGAVTEEEALRQLHEDRPHVVIVFADVAGFVAAAREAFPAIRIVADRELPGVTVVVASVGEARAAVLGRVGPGGPVLGG
ncbi:MAG TPA: hypothetical protein VE669_08915 [Actinomycetota bacterium]|nr:hypothetical protein [Actinomycetota bacterium]